MEGVSIFFVVSAVVGLVIRWADRGEPTRRPRPGTPARFVRFTGRRLKITTRTD